MRSLENRVREQETELARLRRELARAAARPAELRAPRTGWWLAQLCSELHPGGTAAAKIYGWADGAWGCKFVVENVRDFFHRLTGTLPAGTEVRVDWYHTTWVVTHDEAGTVTSTTETTTTLEPCAGRCKWIWDDSAQIWTLDTDNCSRTTTTTTTTQTTTTSEPTTTTTPEPCECPTTTTTTGTTTTGDPCTCIYPAYCGAADGECTYTYCGAGIVPDTGVTCTTTTATTTTDTTTTQACDCNTTTTSTPEPGCTEGCCWIWLPNTAGTFGWRKQSDGCGDECPCSTPAGSGTACQVEYTDCVQTQPPPTTAPPACSGECLWYGYTALDCEGNTLPGGWIKLSDGCTDDIPCYCVQPGDPPSSCGEVVTPCQAPTTTTTTTTTSAPGACWQCYTTTTTTTTAEPTTTTTAECSGECKWEWDGTEWQPVSLLCIGNCQSCLPPLDDGQDACETAITHCREGTTTTTTTETTTTETTTTDTTTTSECGEFFFNCYLCCCDNVVVSCYTNCSNKHVAPDNPNPYCDPEPHTYPCTLCIGSDNPCIGKKIGDACDPAGWTISCLGQCSPTTTTPAP